MRTSRPRLYSRAFRRTSGRKLSPQDLSVLDFLWTWKAASLPVLKELAWKRQSYWWAYRALKQLEAEKYVQLLPRGKNLEQELWALTRNGFEIVLMDRDDIEQYRFRVHAPAHDYLATCLQLGDFWRSGVDVDFFTEQQLSSVSKWNFPPAVFAEQGHIPDGITYIRGALTTAIIGYEVDLNLKDEERYLRTISYYRVGLRPHLIVWLVRNSWIMEKISGLVRRQGSMQEGAHLSQRVVFVLLDDFKKSVWEATVVGGSFAGTSLRKLHANLVQSTGKKPVIFGQMPMRDIFFPKFLSPQKLKALFAESELQHSLTPYGLRGTTKHV